MREVWQDALSKHFLLQIQQKRRYATDRVSAVAGFPSTELYLAVDCGSGHEFVLPHLSSADKEGPSKAVDGFSTVPMKVFNGLVHGDQRSYVILSPGVIGATANHTCECLGVMINCSYKAHGNLPHVLTVQFDGASTNKCNLVLAYLGLYVLHGVFSKVRVRCLLENHAHDVYDAFHAVHARAVRSRCSLDLYSELYPSYSRRIPIRPVLRPIRVSSSRHHLQVEAGSTTSQSTSSEGPEGSRATKRP